MHRILSPNNEKCNPRGTQTTNGHETEVHALVVVFNRRILALIPLLGLCRENTDNTNSFYLLGL
jgi:hypothetical protein